MRKELFNHEITILRDTFRRLLRRKANSNLAKLIKKTHPADLAIIFRYFLDEEQEYVFSIMKEREQTTEFLVELDDTILQKLLEDENPERISMLINQAPTNNQSYIIGNLENEKAQSVINLLELEEKEEIEELMGYPEDSAGAMMTTDVFTIHQDTTCGDALKKLQDQSPAEMVFYLYLTDEDKRLTGVASLRALATSSAEKIMRNIMIKRIHSVRPETDQEEVARIVAQYNYLSVPVLDENDCLLGIVTVDDVVDVIREEATEDFLQMAGAGKDREILLKSSWDNARARLPWLFASWVGGIIAANIIGAFEQLLDSILVLAAFIPVIIGMGGNVGTQSSTIIVRGMATGRVDQDGEIRVFFKEMRVGLILGALYGLLLGLFTKFKFLDADPMLGVVVGLSICASMLLAVTVGSFIPLFLRKLNIDPAIATGPFVTTSIDVLGVLLYFTIAGLLLNI
tara:strand:- start:2343 stop:3713 length:1371 start_codon:yes stop_codon:yes gene_type:complete